MMKWTYDEVTGEKMESFVTIACVLFVLEQEGE